MPLIPRAPRRRHALRSVGLGCALGALLGGCIPTEDVGPSCGPRTGVVARVVDGDTFDLASGERVRLLLVDTPENTSSTECFGPESTVYTASLLLEREIELDYDVECRDDYERLLAYVTLEGRDVNALLLEQGLGCVLHIPPNGDARVEHYRSLAAHADEEGRGLWAACEVPPC